MPHLLGVTGNIATGKTTIGQMLLALGAARYIDADAVVHDLYRPGEAIHAAIVVEFGQQVVATDGQIDRKALGEIVFHDPNQLQRLEALTHPAVNMAIAAQLLDLTADDIAVVDAVKLLEGGFGKLCDAVWLVTCDPAEERRRLITDRHLTEAEVNARLAAQPDNAARRAQVAEVIDNSGTLAATQIQVQAAWIRFTARWADK